jgi:hypothetical protein
VRFYTYYTVPALEGLLWDAVAPMAKKEFAEMTMGE